MSNWVDCGALRWEAWEIEFASVIKTGALQSQRKIE